MIEREKDPIIAKLAVDVFSKMAEIGEPFDNKTDNLPGADIVTPEDAIKELLKGLDLHYNTVQLAAKDSSAAMAKTIDLEVYIPSMNTYKEVSSISNALDYQSRRGNIRFKEKKTNKNKFVYTLNASGLATSRIIPAILEQNQQKDGSVKIPKVLQKYMNKKLLK